MASARRVCRNRRFLFRWRSIRTIRTFGFIFGRRRLISWGGIRFAAELNFNAERTGEAALLHRVEHRLEIDMALANRRKIPQPSLATLVLKVAMDQLWQCDRQIGDRIDAAVEFGIGGIVVDKYVLSVNA